MEVNSRKVVLVTGASGFLGQHIVWELQNEDIDEIRVFDCRPFEQKLDYTAKLPVKSYTGDIRVAQDLHEAMVGVNCVFHAAGMIDVRMFPDMKMLQDVNVNGTNNVIEACIAANVPHLIFTSTVDVSVGYAEIINGDESLPYPEHHLYVGYGTTKQEAEEAVLAANCRPLANGNGQTLHTLSLRPTVMYGEGDPYFVTSMLKQASSRKGTLPRLGSGQALFQCSYVGNIAWAHVCAMKALQSDDSVGGLAYFVNDDSPVRNVFDFVEPFLEVRGFHLSTFRLPFPPLYHTFRLLHGVMSLFRKISEINMVHSPSAIRYTNQSVYFKRMLAEEKLNYKPKYNYSDSLEKSLTFYRSISL